MSFILDALKKSETDRQRQSGPALFEVKVAQPKAGFPVWAIAIVVLLVINMVIVGWLLLRRSSKTEETAAANTPPAAVASPPVPTPAPTPPPAAAISQPAPTNTAPAPIQSNSPPVQQASYPPPPAREETSAEEQQALIAGRAISGRGLNEPTLGNAARTAGNAAAGADTGAPAAAANPDDFAPAQDPGSPLFKGHVKRGTESGLMLYQDLVVTNGANLPELRLDMHVYDPKPQARFALINMQKVTEGQMLRGEVKVEAITPEGVVLSHTGTRFLLPRE